MDCLIRAIMNLCCCKGHNVNVESNVVETQDSSLNSGERVDNVNPITEQPRTLPFCSDNANDKSESTISPQKDVEKCEPCQNRQKDADADFYCRQCSEFLCQHCRNYHQRMTATSHHDILSKKMWEQHSATRMSEKMVPSKETTALSTDCESAKPMRTSCCDQHKEMTTTANYKPEYEIPRIEGAIPEVSNQSRVQRLSNGFDPKENFKPGKPTIDENPTYHSIQLYWTKPKQIYQSYYYQIRYKTTSPAGQWKFHKEQHVQTSVILYNMPSNTSFVFQVRMVCNEEEGPYSDESDAITTPQSAANQLCSSAVEVECFDTGFTKRKLILEEESHSRNDSRNTRKFSIGKQRGPAEKTIMLIGATGSGKSTLVDGFINYIYGVSWDDPIRFTLIEEDERNQALSQSEWITTYSIHPVDGSRLHYTLNIIDTPGFGDTGGVERDKRLVQQFKALFSAPDLNVIDGICFIVKASDARFTQTQRYIFNSVLSLFGQDIVDNMNILITFADGNTPPVLAALEEAHVLHNKYFKFNNSALFTDSRCPKTSPLAPILWDMNYKGFAELLNHIKTMETKSLQ